MIEVCFATNNAHKIAEIQDMLGNEFVLKSLADIGCYEELPETTDTIEGNSHQKAEYVWQHYGIACFADDSGLEIDALAGAPGVHSAYYSGERNHQKNIERVLSELTDESNRKANFKTVITLALAGKFYQFTGIVEGNLLNEPVGNQGFGYDPIFVPQGHNRTFAQMSIQEKSQLSHRARAFQQLKEFLGNTSS